MEKSGGATTDVVGGIRNSPNSGPIEIIDPHAPKVTLAG